MSVAAYWLLVSLLSVACERTVEEVDAGHGSFRVVAHPVPDSLHPYRLIGYSFHIGQIYSSLTAAYLPGKHLSDIRFRLDLAQSVDVSDDGSTCLIRLRDGVRFHNGEPLTVDDALYSLRRWMSAREAIRNSTTWIPGFTAERTGAMTLRLRSSDSVDWLRALTIPILNARYEESFAIGPPLAYRPMGTGPYRFDSFDPEAGVLRLARFDEYYGGKPLLENTAITFYADAEAAAMAMLRDEADYIADISANNAAYVRNKGDGYSVGSLLVPSLMQIVFNTRREPFRRAEVRRGISLLIDRTALGSVMGGMRHGATPTDSPLHAMAPVSTPALIPFAPERGISLLGEQGCRMRERVLRCGGEPLIIVVLVAERDRSRLPSLRLIVRQLREAGIGMKVVFRPDDVIIREVDEGRFEAALLQFQEYRSRRENESYYASWGKRNRSMISDPAIDRFFGDPSGGEEASAEKKAILQERLSHIAPTIPLYYLSSFYAVRNISAPLSQAISSDPYFGYWIGRIGNGSSGRKE
jgi:peptide/nickel transport system substrate-binding protein